MNLKFRPNREAGKGTVFIDIFKITTLQTISILLNISKKCKKIGIVMVLNLDDFGFIMLASIILYKFKE